MMQQPDDFNAITGLTISPMTDAQVVDQLNTAGIINCYAMARLRIRYPYAVQPREVKESFPQAVTQTLHALARTITDSDYRNSILAELEEEQVKVRKLFDLRPDMFSVNQRTGAVVCHEIEDTSVLKDYKIRKYIRAYNWCDESDLNITLTVLVHDRYGDMTREIDLGLLWMAFERFTH